MGAGFALLATCGCCQCLALQAAGLRGQKLRSGGARLCCLLCRRLQEQQGLSNSIPVSHCALPSHYRLYTSSGIAPLQSDEGGAGPEQQQPLVLVCLSCLLTSN